MNSKTGAGGEERWNSLHWCSSHSCSSHGIGEGRNSRQGGIKQQQEEEREKRDRIKEIRNCDVNRQDKNRAAVRWKKRVRQTKKEPTTENKRLTASCIIMRTVVDGNRDRKRITNHREIIKIKG